MYNLKKLIKKCKEFELFINFGYYSLDILQNHGEKYIGE